MNKRIYLMIMVLLLVIGGVKAQTVDIHEITATPGAVQVQLDMLNYTNVAAISLYINYDTDLLSFTDITNTTLTGGWTFSASNGLINILYQATPYGTGYPINGKLLDLNFNYTGGFASDLTFTNDCEIVNSSLAEVPSTFLNGSVSNDPNMNTYTGATGFMSGYAEVGDLISWPLIIIGNPAFPGAFQTINSFTLHLSYDPAKLTYQSINGNPALTGMTVTGGGGFIDVAWSSPTAQDLSNALLGYLNFTYNGGGLATLSFEPGSVVTSGTTIQNTYFVAGTVDVDPAGPFDGSITISQVGSTMGTANVNVPVVASGLSDNPAGAINFTMTFDPAEMTYKGYTANQFTGWVVNQSPAGTLNFIKTSTTPLTIADGPLVTLKFDYLINTQADITFMGGTSIQSTAFAYIPTDFVDGFISTNYTLTATAGAHGGLAADYTGSYFWGTVVPIEGVANTGYKLLNWTGTGSAYIADVLDATTTVTIPASNIAVQANFEVDPAQFFDLTLTTGAHGTSTTGTGSYNVETVVNISATAATGYRFKEWTGTGLAYVADAIDATTTVTMPAAAIGLTANFEPDPTQFFDLTVTTGTNGVSTTGTGSYNVEEVVNITATAATGYRFKEWTGTGLAYVADPVDASTTVTMPAAAIGLTANFEPDPTQFFDLTVTTGTNGVSTTGTGSYNVEEVVNITATAATGYRFKEWTGTGLAYVTDAVDATTTLTMPAAAIGLTANFEPDPTQLFDLSLVLGANGASVSGDGSYNVGDEVIISASAASGYYFVEWTGDISYITTGTANDASVTITMPAQNIELTSVFSGMRVSGKLKYASVDIRPITNSTVDLKLVSDNSTFATTTTDLNGDYIFNDVPDGEYYLEASTTKVWAGTFFVDIDDAIDVYDFWDVGTPVLSGINFTAGDTNQDGNADIDDAIDIYDYWDTGLKPTMWTIPDWVFESPSVTVSGSNISIDIRGLCAGDVNASFNPIP